MAKFLYLTHYFTLLSIEIIARQYVKPETIVHVRNLVRLRGQSVIIASRSASAFRYNLGDSPLKRRNGSSVRSRYMRYS